MPPVALFTATALALALTAGFGLGLWLLLARTFQLPLAGASWLALVQVHGVIQLFGFVGLFMMGVGLHLLPRLRGASVPRRRWQLLIYALALSGLLIRAVAQPTPALVGREPLLALSALLLVGAAALFAATALRTLASGANPHRADELVIAAGVSILPIAAGLAAIGSIDGWPTQTGLAPPQTVVSPRRTLVGLRRSSRRRSELAGQPKPSTVVPSEPDCYNIPAVESIFPPKVYPATNDRQGPCL